MPEFFSYVGGQLLILDCLPLRLFPGPKLLIDGCMSRSVHTLLVAQYGGKARKKYLSHCPLRQPCTALSRVALLDRESCFVRVQWLPGKWNNQPREVTQVEASMEYWL